MKKCTHTIYVEGTWETYTTEDYDGNVVQEQEWSEGWYKPSVIDVDLHHYKCTLCHKIMRY